MIRELVDQIIMERGCYLPEELLLSSGRLDQEDLVAWRRGELAPLAALLYGSPLVIAAELAEAADHALALGLTKEQRLLYRADGGEPLQLSNDRALEQLLASGYRRRSLKESPQLDLFIDSGPQLFSHDLVEALGAADRSRAIIAYQKLQESYPSYTHLGDLQWLVQNLLKLLGDADSLSSEEWLERLEGEGRLQAVATQQLADSSQGYLAPFWRHLSQAWRDSPFDPDHPYHHSSYPLQQLGERQAALRSISRVSNWAGSATLSLRRLQLLQDEGAGVERWFWFACLAREHPASCEAAMSTLTGEWRDHWLDFLDLDPHPGRESYLTWLLLTRPQLAQSAEDQLAGLADPVDQAARGLALCRAGSSELIELRDRLKSVAPILFNHYMATIHAGENG
jgi:hypothetical protein